MGKEKIAVVSTEANDILINSEGKIFSRQPGGPTLFIERALKDSRVPYKLFKSDVIDVHILVTDEGEFGKVPSRPIQRKLGELNVRQWAIVSTVLNEWIINDGPLPDKLFIDLQGFVRDGNDFGKKRRWEEINEFADKVFCLKGTEEEVACLPPAIIEDQKNRLLIITKGTEGADIFDRRKFTHISVEEVTGIPNTIGAGDSFLAYFVAAMYQGSEPAEAGAIAAQKTTEFLKQKFRI